MPPRLIGCALALLIGLFGLRCFRTWRVFNDTTDESGHIACGLEVWQTGRYTLETQHPPLAHMVLALPPFLAGLRQSEENRRTNHHLLWTTSEPEFYWRTLSLARFGNLIFAPFLVGYVYVWGRALYGPAAGLGAAALASLSPNLLAHASLATLDFGAAVTTLAAAYHFWRWSREPGLRNCLLAALAFGVAVLVKLSAVFFVPAIAAVFFLLARRRQWPGWRTAVKHGALFVGVAGLGIWAGYLFDVGPLPPAEIPPVAGTSGQYLESAYQVLIGSGAIPAPRLARGILDVLAHNARGHPCYLLGRVSQFGWWYYFPVALAVKTTIPLLLLVAMAVWTLPKRPETAAPLVAAAVILAIGMASHMDLGIRYILAIYPFLALAAAGLFAGPRVVAGIALALAAWHGAESLLAHPDYLAYFNQIARGREERFLLDSNLDWGQDLERLRRYLEANHISTVYLSYFGAADPRRLGIHGVRPLSSDARPTGWVAASVNHLFATRPDQADLTWLKGRRPVARVGKSILVYHFSGHGS
ncbi:MAG: glycosyltransferase family 39 protein [Acidobacteria bacterium]|nr:glycosyltransferase family 39 protein [Acidobacteriota bacterium]